MGTIGATVKPDGSVFAGVISTEGTASNSSWGIDSKALSPVALASLDSVSLNGQPQTVRLQDAGSYRMRSTETAAGATVLVGIPTKSVDNAIQRLVLVEVVLSVVCIAVAGIASAGMVSGALLPLRRVAVTAGRVSALPLERGTWILRSGCQSLKQIRAQKLGRWAPHSIGCWTMLVRR